MADRVILSLARSKRLLIVCSILRRAASPEEHLSQVGLGFPMRPVLDHACSCAHTHSAWNCEPQSRRLNWTQLLHVTELYEKNIRMLTPR